MPGAEPPVLVLCPLDQTQSVVQSATVVSNSPPIFCSCFDKPLCRNPTSSGQAFWVRQDGYLLHLRGLYTHRPAHFCVGCAFIAATIAAAAAVRGLRHFWMLPAPLWSSLLFDGCISHFGFLVQTNLLFSRWWRFKWWWRRRRRQRRTAADATPFLVVTSCRWRQRLISFALWAMSLALRLLHTRFLGCLSKAIAGSLQSLVAFGGRHQHCFHAGTTLF